jgi:hypothetical protein
VNVELGEGTNYAGAGARARFLCDHDSLPQELDSLNTIFKNNGYSQQQIDHALKPATQTEKEEKKPHLNCLSSVHTDHL